LSCFFFQTIKHSYIFLNVFTHYHIYSKILRIKK
jgi:hypothetical protein